jgi:hypothetical protein
LKHEGTHMLSGIRDACEVRFSSEERYFVNKGYGFY